MNNRDAWKSDEWAVRQARRPDRRALSIEFLRDLQAQTPACKCCGVTLRWRRENAQGFVPDVATLDRVIPTAGYVPWNVQILCNLCNTRKSHMTIADLQRIIRYIERFGTDYGA